MLLFGASQTPAICTQDTMTVLSSPHVVFMIIFCFPHQKILPVFLILMDAILGMLFLSELLQFTNSHSMKWTIVWQSKPGEKKRKKKKSLKRQIFYMGSSPFHRFFCKECLVVHQVKQQASFLQVSSLRLSSYNFATLCGTYLNRLGGCIFFLRVLYSETKPLSVVSLTGQLLWKFYVNKPQLNCLI